MSEIRSVSVHLDADVAGYIAKMRLAGAETDKAFGRSAGIERTNVSLSHAETNLRKVDAEARRVDSSLTRVNNRFNQGGNQIDKYSGRLKVIGQALAILGPGLVPLSAVGIPAALGMASALASVAGGLITTKIATIGLGPAITALNKAQLQPTAENLQAAHLALSQLPPDAREFAVELAHLDPQLDKLRDSAASGLFPGLEVGLHRIERDLPIVNRILHSTGTEVGHLASEAGQSLSSPSWREFLRFIEHEGPPSLEQIGQSLGHVTHGVAELVMAGAPLEHGFLGAVLRGSVNFDHWAQGAKDTQWLRDLIAYIDANGPRVEHFLGDTADLVINIVRAAAPLGGPVLNSLDAIARVLNAVVSSPAGPTILATVSALSLLSRGQALFGKVATSSWAQAISGADGYRAKLSAARVPLTRGALALGGLAVAATGAASGLGLSNTATLALTGSLAGPWGAAVGAGVGLLLDFTHHEDNSAAATTDFTTTLNQQTGAITENTRAQVANVLQQDGAFDAATRLGVGLDTLTSAATGNKAALAEVNGQLAFYLHQTSPGYVAGGAQVIPPEQQKAARDLSEELGLVGGHLSADQRKTRQLAAAMHGNATAADHARVAHHRLRLEIKASRQANAEAIQQWNTLGNNVDKAGVSLTRWTHQLQHQADAVLAFGNNALKAARKGLDEGLIAKLNEMGPAGALRMRQLANASQSEIGRANHAWRSLQDNIDTTTGDLNKATSHPWRIQIENQQAIDAAKAVEAALRSIQDKVVHITTVRTTGGRSLPGQAEGGHITGPGGPTDDQIPAWLSNGEYVVRAAMVDRYGLGFMHAVNAGAYAGGGPVATHVTRTVGGQQVDPITKHINAELHKMRQNLADVNKELQAEQQHRQNLVQAEKQLESTVASNFRSQIFGVTPEAGIWGSGATSDPRQILRGDIRDARSYRRDVRRLRGRGLRGGALVEVTTLEDAEQALGLPSGELRDISRLYQVRRRASQVAGATLGDFRYGAQLAQANHHLKELRGDVHRLQAEIHHQTVEQHKHAKATGDAVAKGVNSGVRAGVQRGSKP